MSRKIRFAILIALLGVILASAGTVVLVNRELSQLRARIETALTTALAREVVIEGNLSVGLAFATEVVGEGIRISNPDWASRDYLAYVDRAEIQFELLPLLRDGLFIVSNLAFEGVDVRLEQTEEGLNNWTIPGREQEPAQLPQVHKLALQGSTIVLALAGAPERRFRVDDFEAARTGRLGLELSATGAFGNRTFDVEAKGGPSRDLSQRDPWPFELLLIVDELRADLKGELAEPFSILGATFELNVVGGDAGWLERLFRPNLIPLRYEFFSSVLLTQSGFRLSDARGHVADLGPAGDLTLTSGALVYEGGTVDLASAGELDGLPFEVSLKAPGVPSPTALTGVTLQGRLGDTQFDVSGNSGWMDGALDLDIGLAVATPRIDDLSQLLNVALPSLGPFRASGRLKTRGGSFDVTELLARLGESQLTGNLSIEFSSQRPRLSGRLNSTQIDLSDFGGSAESVLWSRALFDAALPSVWLVALDAELELAVETLLGAPVPVRNLSLVASIEGGRLRVEPLSASISAVDLRGAASLSHGASPAIEFALQAEELHAEDVLRLFELPEVVRGVFSDLDLQLNTSGRSLGEMLARAELSLSTGTGDVEVVYGRGEGPLELHLKSAEGAFGPGRPAGLVLFGDVGTLPVDLTLSGGQLSSLIRDGRPWPALNLVLNTRLMGKSATLAGSVSPFAALLNRGDVSLELTGKFAGIDAEANAVISLRGDIIRTPLDVHLWSDNTAELIALMGLNPALATSFDAHGVVELADGSINVRNVNASTPFRDVTGGEFIVALAKPAHVTAEFDLDALDLDRLTIDLTESTNNGEPIQDRLLSARTLPLHLLKAIDVDSTLRIKQLHVFGVTLSNVTTSSLIEQGTLSWRAATNDGSVAASIHIDARSVVPQATLDTQWRDYRARRATSATEVPAVTPGIGLDLVLAGQGESIASFFETARGEIKLWAGPGKLRSGREGFLGRNLVLQILDTLRPASRAAAQTDLDCAAAYFEVIDGIASSTRGIAIQTRDLNVVGGGAINFGTEELSARFRFQPRRGFGLNIAGMTVPFVNIDGTLLDYRVRLNKGASIAAGGAAWASGGLSLLYTGLLQRIFSARRPCERVLPELAQN